MMGFEAMIALYGCWSLPIWWSTCVNMYILPDIGNVFLASCMVEVCSHSLWLATCEWKKYVYTVHVYDAWKEIHQQTGLCMYQVLWHDRWPKKTTSTDHPRAYLFQTSLAHSLRDHGASSLRRCLLMKCLGILLIDELKFEVFLDAPWGGGLGSSTTPISS